MSGWVDRIEDHKGASFAKIRGKDEANDDYSHDFDHCPDRDGPLVAWFFAPFLPTMPLVVCLVSGKLPDG